jgi:hypothetical protein
VPALSEENIIKRVLTGLVKALEAIQIPYVIVGGIAVIVHGRIRTTTGIDVILDHTELNHEEFVRELNDNGFDASLNDMRNFDERLHVSFFFKKTMFRIDIKGMYEKKDRISIQETKTQQFGEITLQIDAPENIIVNKLLFGSEIDIEDAMAVLAKNLELDLHKIKSKSSVLGVHDEFQKLLEKYEGLK